MPQIALERTIKIHAPASKVWDVITKPEYTHHFGGEIVTDWQVGSSYGWKGLDGKMYTQGHLLQLDQPKVLQYDLLRPDGHGGGSNVFSTVTYELTEEGEYTNLLAREEFMIAVTEQEYTLAGAAWYEALAQLKDLAEKQSVE